MYGYELDYGYEPATEGIGSFFEMVWEKIKKFAEWIKDKMGELKLKIQRMTGSTTAEQARKDSAEVTKKIGEIRVDINAILSGCCDAIDELYTAYEKVGARTELKKGEYNKINKQDGDDVIGYTHISTNDGKTKYYDYSKSMTSNNGMNKMRKDVSDSESKEWNAEKQKLGEIFAKQAGSAEKVSADLKSLASYGPLTKTATENGYTSLREIFNSNGEFANKWKKVKIAAEWSTGFIKESLNKIVKMYDVGVRATQAFGKRLAGGNFRDDKGNKIKSADKKETMSSYKGLNKVYNDKGNYDIKSNRKAKDFSNIQYGTQESALLDRLYQMAYEDAMNDIAEQQYAMEAYDMVPGAYEFVDDLGYDPSLDYDV
jgi:hypothetical protein